MAAIFDTIKKLNGKLDDGQKVIDGAQRLVTFTGPRGTVTIDPQTRDIDRRTSAPMEVYKQARRQARPQGARHGPAGEGRSARSSRSAAAPKRRPAADRAAVTATDKVSLRASAATKQSPPELRRRLLRRFAPRNDMRVTRWRASDGVAFSMTHQHPDSSQHPVRRPGLRHVPVHRVGRPVGHHGADGLRQSRARRLRDGGRLSRPHRDARAGTFRSSFALLLAFVVVGAVSVVFERTLYRAPLQGDRARSGAAHHRPRLHGDRGLHLFLRTAPAD